MDVVVWQDGVDIYGYLLFTGTVFPICINPTAQHQPDIWANIVVWEERGEANRDIYGARLSVNQYP